MRPTCPGGGGPRLRMAESVAWQVTEPARAVVAPFAALFSARSDGWAFLHALLASAWTALVWGVLGGAIARIAIESAPPMASA